MNDDVNTFRPKKLSLQDIKDGCIELTHEQTGNGTRLCIIQEELRQGLELAESIDRSVTCFGSARLGEHDPHYKQARDITYRIAKELGYTVITGGGPGIMEAANRGAYEAGGRSIGMTIKLPHEQSTNPFVTDEVPFYFFFTRKVAMTYSSEAYLYFPGGFGTMDEFFEILTLVQTGKIARVPIILIGEDYWRPLDQFIKQRFLKEHHTVTPEESLLYTITDNEDHILDIVRNAPIRTED